MKQVTAKIIANSLKCLTFWVKKNMFVVGCLSYLYEIIALFLDPATMASVWQLGASGPMNPAMFLKKNLKKDNQFYNSPDCVTALLSKMSSFRIPPRHDCNSVPDPPQLSIRPITHNAFLGYLSFQVLG